MSADIELPSLNDYSFDLDETSVNFKDGDIVWTKLGSSWWPGEVKDPSNVPEDLLSNLKKTPLVIVKFFDEDSYEYVRKKENIYPYNCDKKNEFIKKGMASFRANANHMKKFPKDVTIAEEKIGGNPNILSDPMFLPEKKPTYEGYTPSPKRKKHSFKLKGRLSGTKMAPDRPPIDESRITHRRFLGHDDYESFIFIQTPEKYRSGQTEDEENEALNVEHELEQDFNCHSCPFKTKRLEVMMLHIKSHIHGVYLTTTNRTPKKLSTKRPKKENIRRRKSNEHTTESDSDVEFVRKKEKTPKERKTTSTERLKYDSSTPTKDDSLESSRKVYKSRKSTTKKEKQDHGSSLDKDDILESTRKTYKARKSTTKKDDSSSTTKDSLESSRRTYKPRKSTTKKEKNETETTEKQPSITTKPALTANDITSNLLAEWDDNDDELEEILGDKSEKETPKPVEEYNDKELEEILGGSSEKETPKPVEGEISVKQPPKKEEPSEKTMNKDIQEAIKSCFDFDDNEEEEFIAATTSGRKIPRVIPEKRKSQDIEEDIDREAILKESESFNRPKPISEEVDDEFAKIMESTELPSLPEVTNTLKPERNFHDAKMAKTPDKLEPKNDKKESEVATRLTNPKKRFVKSFEDFELEMRRKEEQEASKATTEESPDASLSEDTASKAETPLLESHEDSTSKESEIETTSTTNVSAIKFEEFVNQEISHITAKEANSQSEGMEDETPEKTSQESLITELECENKIVKETQPVEETLQPPKKRSRKTSENLKTPKGKILESYIKEIEEKKPEEMLESEESHLFSSKEKKLGERLESEEPHPFSSEEKKPEEKLEIEELHPLSSKVKKPEEKMESEGIPCATSNEVHIGPSEPEEIAEVVPPKKKGWSRRGRHPKKDKPLDLEVKEVESVEISAAVAENPAIQSVENKIVVEQNSAESLELSNIEDIIGINGKTTDIKLQEPQVDVVMDLHSTVEEKVVMADEITPFKKKKRIRSMSSGNFENIQSKTLPKLDENFKEESDSCKLITPPKKKRRHRSVQDDIFSSDSSTSQASQEKSVELPEIVPEEIVSKDIVTEVAEEVAEEMPVFKDSSPIVETVISKEEISVPLETEPLVYQSSDVPTEKAQVEETVIESTEEPQQSSVRKTPETVEKASVSVDEMPVSIEDIPISFDIPVATEETGFTTEAPQVTTDTKSTKEEHITTEEAHVIAEEEHVKAEEEHVKTEEEHVKAEEHIKAEEEHVTAEEEHVTAEEEHVTDKETCVTAQETHVTTEERPAEKPIAEALEESSEGKNIPTSVQSSDISEEMSSVDSFKHDFSSIKNTSMELSEYAMFPTPDKKRSNLGSEDSNIDRFFNFDSAFKKNEELESKISETTPSSVEELPKNEDSESSRKSDGSPMEETPVSNEPRVDTSEHHNEMEIKVADDDFKFSIQTNLTNFSKAEEMSALTLAALSEIHKEEAEQEASMRNEDKKQEIEESFKSEEVGSKCEEASKPEEITKDEEASKPEEIASAEDISKPEELPKPEETPKPEELPKPEETPKPEELPKPEEMPKPEDQPIEESHIESMLLDKPEMVQIEGTVTVMSEKDLAEGQVEITSEKVISPKKQPTFSSFSLDFHDQSRSPQTSGTEIPTKAMTNILEKSPEKRHRQKTYGRLELLDILEGNSDSSGSEPATAKPQTTPIAFDKKDVDFEDCIPSQIVCAKPRVENQSDDSSQSSESIPTSKPTSKLLERLTESKPEKKKTIKINASDIKLAGSSTKLLTEDVTAKTKAPPKLVLRNKMKTVRTVGTKAIILSEQIIKPASEENKQIAPQSTKRQLDDIEDVEAFVIHKKIAGNHDQQQPDQKPLTEQPKPTPKPVKARQSNKPKILNQTIITPQGEIIHPGQAQQTSTDEMVFDINSMPIVLSDELLTAESLEKMPIVLSSDNVQQAAPGGKVVVQEKPSVAKKPAGKAVGQAGTHKGKVPRILQSGNKVVRQPPSPLLPLAAKPGKYIIVPSNPTTSIPQGKLVTTKTVVKRGMPSKLANIVPNTSEPVGNKIMIVTNQQGQQQRLILTPAQQKMLQIQPGKSPGTPKTMIKQTVAKTLLNSDQPGPSGIISKTPTILPNKTIIPASTISSDASTPLLARGIVRNTTRKTPVRTPGSKTQKTILIKNQHGQTVRKIQGTDDKELDKQVAEQLEAIRASARMNAQNKANQQQQETTKQTKTPNRRVSYSRKTAQTSEASKTKQMAKSEAMPGLSPIGQVKKSIESTKVTAQGQPVLQQTMVTQPVPSQPEPAKVATLPTATHQETNKPDRPLNQLVIQDAMGVQTTITEGQIVALPSETVDGQPQSYMLVTLDEHGNLTPLNNEALMSLDPNLGMGLDLGNMVLQIDQGQGALALVNPTEAQRPPAVVENKPAVAEPVVPKAPPVSNMVPVQDVKPTEKEQIVMENVQQTVVNAQGVLGGQQLILTGDPVATQKFLESLSEGTTDLASILANAEGNSILIQADGQQILINTNSDGQNLPVLPEPNENGGNPVFATQPPNKKNQDILAAALADTDVFQQEQPMPKSQLSPNGGLYPMNVGNVLETSLTLSSPIMTPLEVPSTNNKKIDDEADILNQVPKNVDLPITITDPSISQTVAQQQILITGSEPQSNLELTLPISEAIVSATSTDMNNPYVYSLPTLDETVVSISQKPFNSSMPLLTEDEDSRKSTEDNNKTDEGERRLAEFQMQIKNIELGEQKAKEETSESGYIDEGLCTLGGEMCSSLSEPPPDMFEIPGVNGGYKPVGIDKDEEISSDLSSAHAETSSINSSEGSCEIPVQPQIVAKLSELQSPKTTSYDENSDQSTNNQ